MRTWHRWLMTAFSLLLVYWVGAGLAIALFDLADPAQVWALHGGGPGARLDGGAAAARPLPAPATLTEGIGAALRQSGDMVVASADLRMAGALVRLELAEADGARVHRRYFDASTGEKLPRERAEDNPYSHMTPHMATRETVKSFHKGDAGGLAGQTLGLIAGLGLTAMAVTGMVLYAKLWSGRRKLGRPGLVWAGPKESRWRVFHRAVALFAALFILNKGVTGSILAGTELLLQMSLRYGVGTPPYPLPTPTPPVSAGKLPPDIATQLQTGYAASAALHPGAKITAVTLVTRDGGQAHALVTLGAPQIEIAAYDSLGGAPVADWATGGVQVGNGYFTDWHQVLKRLHRGDIVGRFSGRYLDIATGLALLYLLTSGFVMYVDLHRRRMRMDRRGLFWR